MFKKVMAALLATVAFMPAAHAQDGDGQGARNAGVSRRAEMREARQQAIQARGEAPRQYQRQEAPQQAQRPAEAPRAEQAPRFQRQPDQPRPTPQVQTQAQPQRQWQGYGDRGSRGNMFAERAQRQQAEQQAQVQAQPRQRDGDRNRGNQQGDWRRDDAGRNPVVTNDQRRDGDRTVGDQRRLDNNNNGRWNDGRRNGSNNNWGNNNNWGSNNNGNGRTDWSRRWRDDNRYDWGRYRQQNRNLFRLPRYYAPYDWSYGYRRYSIGVTLSSLLWSQDYWIDEPEYYRLPPAYGPYRWVRYYNDALLVDIRTGYVVDTVYDIFWG